MAVAPKIKFTFDGTALRVHEWPGGNLLHTFPANSGRPGSTLADQHKHDYGPIPAGNYTMANDNFVKNSLIRRLKGDWGSYRAALQPDRGTNTFGRSDFFIHGGSRPGSAGCIDVGQHDSMLHDLVKQYGGPVPVEVRYPD